ncbi:TetR/AcrR family transcriptional regulator [Actinoplanes sp. L3-i22]|uniref:TetR/AcrR family transcriptional regulator n=1 Tax=Actinoplanes sp. L3-i22 TaxID=2836373 RepID=UPI001C7906C4|nr:TetR family transcriptional regulator [Actinoplanes sp. L3-i22]BCY12760.1 TetR family transcriptional regulator [Actinoplanes sp. L3-i22]
MPALPTSARGAATSRRILDAAAEEFAERGIAGARVDRIMVAAQTNKAQLYGYFGSKDALFDAVVADRAERLIDALSFDAADLPGFAVAVYDENLRHPELVRLTGWLRLERRPVGRLGGGSADEPKFQAIARAQAAGQVRAGDPVELFALVLAMACAWSPASTFYVATADEPEESHARRRALLRDSVRRLVAP